VQQLMESGICAKKYCQFCFLVLSFLFGASALAVPPDLASMDWSVKAPNNLAANPPTEDVIKTFLSKFDGDPPGICEAHFADLQHSDTLSLVVSENDGRFCHLFVVNKTAAGFQRYSFDLSLGTDGPEIKDLDGNGKLELIVPTDLSGSQGGGYCGARWPVIYAWTGSSYSDVSSHYKGYYEQQLASLQKEITAAEAQKERAEEASTAQGTGPTASAASEPPTEQQSTDANSPPVTPQLAYGSAGVGMILMKPSQVPVPQSLDTPEPDRDGLNCTKAEAAKIERFLGINRDAGMSDAIRWANSDDPDDRSFAADVLGDIATPEAMSYLRTLSRDPNSGVAISGKYDLQQADQGPVVHTVDLKSIAIEAGTPAKRGWMLLQPASRECSRGRRMPRPGAGKELSPAEQTSVRIPFEHVGL
jgi:hypothetical protein